MGVISVSLPSDGTTADVADFNTPITTIVNAINGGLDNSNIATGAAIATSKLADDAGITDAKVSGVSSKKLANPYKFAVYRNAAYTTVANATTVLPFDTKLFDTSSNVDVTTNKGRFTVPIAGFYQFNASFLPNSSSSARTFLAVYKNGITGTEFIRSTDTSIGGLAAYAASFSFLMQLAVGDFVEIGYFTGAAVAITPGTQNQFSGFLVSAT